MDLPDPDPSFLCPFGVPGSRGLRTERGFRRGEVVCPIPATARHRRPERTTVQLDESTHAEVGILTSMNHSCDPNVRLDTSRMLVVAERDIAPGEELTYFYPSTEWDMAEPFECGCGSRDCLGVIRGAKHLPPEVLDRYFANRHVHAPRQTPSMGGGR